MSLEREVVVRGCASWKERVALGGGAGLLDVLRGGTCRVPKSIRTTLRFMSGDMGNDIYAHSHEETLEG